MSSHRTRLVSSIHILYNQVLVGGHSDSFDPGTRIANVQLQGGTDHPPASASSDECMCLVRAVRVTRVVGELTPPIIFSVPGILISC